MNNKLFDDFIKDKLHDQTAVVPADMWARILREKNKNRKSFFWWESFGALAVLVCMAGFFGWFGPLANAKTASYSIPVSINQPSIAVLDKSLSVQPPADNQTQKTGIPQSDIHPGKTATTNFFNEENITKHELIVLPSANIETVGKSTVFGKSLKIDKHQIVKSVNNWNQLPTTKNNLLKAITTEVLKANNQSLLRDENENLVRPQYDRLSLMASMQKAPAKTERDTKNLMSRNNLKAMALSSVDCPSDRITGSHGFYAELFGSPDVSFKKMEYKSTAANNYASRKDSTATKQLSYTVGMRLVKEIGQSMVLKTGLQYSQINERFDYRNENERTTSTVITIRTITNSNGTTTTIRDTSIVEQVGYRVKTTSNRYRSWDIPIILGYEFAGGGWSASINGGAVFNLSSSQVGAFLDTSYTPSSFTKNGPAIFKSKLGVALYGGVSLIKDISPNTALFAEPYLKYSLSDRTTDKSPFTSRFQTAGVLLGIRFKLNGSRAAK